MATIEIGVCEVVRFSRPVGPENACKRGTGEILCKK